jgi:hypothetical protein
MLLLLLLLLLQAWHFEDYGKEDLLAITREAARKK